MDVIGIGIEIGIGRSKRWGVDIRCDVMDGAVEGGDVRIGGVRRLVWERWIWWSH